MPTLLSLLLTLAQFSAQFSAEMPVGVPAVSGAVTERAVLRSIDTRVGTGDLAKPGQEYTVHYTGWLRDGTKFDSSAGRNTPFQFTQGRRHVIAGWESGFEGMRVGGKRRLFIPYQMAYGEAGRGAIPPKAELVFDLELLAVRDQAAEVATLGLLVALKEYEDKLLALARAIPDDKYAWRATPATRTIQEVLVHAAVETRAMGDKAETPKVTSKAEVIALLEECFAAARLKLEPLRPAQLAQERVFLGEKTTAGGVYTQTITHAAEHLGQLIAYARMQGMVPPWSRGTK